MCVCVALHVYGCVSSHVADVGVNVRVNVCVSVLPFASRPSRSRSLQVKSLF